MNSDHFKMIPKRKITSFVSIATSYFNWWVWGFGKNLPVGLPDTQPMVLRLDLDHIPLSSVLGLPAVLLLGRCMLDAEAQSNPG